MASDPECPICLESINDPDIVGIVHRCSHQYHEQCLLQWSSHSNSCPTCRKPFHKINVAIKNTPNVVLRSFNVQDKLLPNPAINSIPAEYVIPPHVVPQRDEGENERDVHPGGVCQICSSASYTLMRRAMASCVACNAAFHVSCLGAASHEPGSTEWFCPVCDCYQELYSAPSSRAARRAPARSLPSRRNHTLITTDSDLAQHTFEESLDLLDRAPGILERRPRTNVLNGGVLLRREERALRNLTPEEATLWNMLEQARAGGQADLPALESVERPRRKRRRRTQEAPAEAPPQVSHQQNPEAGSSRIGALMNQIKTRPQRNNSPLQERPVLATPGPLTQTGPVTRLSPLISPVTSDSESESRRPMELTRKELTLDQKRIIQKFVRDNLRPLYTPNETSSAGTITSEDEYIRINKSISRKIYLAILSLDEDSDLYDDYFENPSSKLRDLVDCCVQRELAGLRHR